MKTRSSYLNVTLCSRASCNFIPAAILLWQHGEGPKPRAKHPTAQIRRSKRAQDDFWGHMTLYLLFPTVCKEPYSITANQPTVNTNHLIVHL